MHEGTKNVCVTLKELMIPGNVQRAQIEVLRIDQIKVILKLLIVIKVICCYLSKLIAESVEHRASLYFGIKKSKIRLLTPRRWRFLVLLVSVSPCHPERVERSPCPRFTHSPIHQSDVLTFGLWILSAQATEAKNT